LTMEPLPVEEPAYRWHPDALRPHAVVLVQLDPTVGHEIRKTRPWVILSPVEMNRHLRTVIVAPMTTVSRPYPTRVPVRFDGVDGQVALDQLRSLDRQRIIRLLGKLADPEVRAIKAVLRDMLVED
jgi:mRNA interferase MazF